MAEVIGRAVQILHPDGWNLVGAVGDSICAQDLFQHLNPNQDVPLYKVGVTGVSRTPGFYTTRMHVIVAAQPIAHVSITRKVG